MKIYILVLGSLMVLSFGQLGCVQLPDETVEKRALSFFDKTRNEITPKFENVAINEIKPKGWIRAQIVQDLEQGFVPKIDALVPAMFEDEVFGSTRRSEKIEPVIVGNQELTGAAWEVSMRWWSAETQGNTWDGLMRNAFLVNNSAIIGKVDSIVNEILATQDDDDYLGIYKKDIRYRHEGSNGELWSQTVLFRFLLGYYEFSGKKEVLDAVVRAMRVTMLNYNENAESPFDVSIDYGGVTHGLMMTDVCETLHRITKDEQYLDYAVFLYKNFSEYPITRAMNDCVYEYLMQKDSLFVSHSAHTYEHLRTLILAKNYTGYPELKEAYESAMHKLEYCILPSGAGFGDEWLGGKKADVDSTAAEYCGMLELRNFYTSALQKTGSVAFADKAERLTFNAMQGARDSTGSAITYCKTDNCVVLDRTSPHSGYKEEDMRYKYSPTHADAAVCCNPSYSRNLPYYTSNMWMRSKDGFAAVLYGASELSTTYDGSQVNIEEITDYPFSDHISFDVHSYAKKEFKIYLRVPDWTSEARVECQGAKISDENGFKVLTKIWGLDDRIELSFENEIREVNVGDKIALQRGALVYALEIPDSIKIVKNWGQGDFKDYYVLPVDQEYADLQFINSHDQQGFGFTYIEGKYPSTNHLWYSNNTHLVGEMYNARSKKNQEVWLTPMGGTILRKVAFSSSE